MNTETRNAPLVHRTFDAAYLNDVSNHHEVRPTLGGSGDVDWSAIIDDPENIALVCEGGGWVFQMLMPGLYEAHSQFVPERRGKIVVDAAREAVRYMFAGTGCVEIVSKVPQNNNGAIGLARSMGFREKFRRDDAWETGVAISYVGLGLDRWRMSDPECLVWGRKFHDVLKAAGGAEHADDEVHDRAVGACVMTCLQDGPDGVWRVGEAIPRKGVGLYNQWALFVGYAPIHLLSEDPVVVDIQEAVIGLTPDGELRVI